MKRQDDNRRLHERRKGSERRRNDFGRAEGNWRANIERRRAERRARRKEALTEAAGSNTSGKKSVRLDQLYAENDDEPKAT